MMETTTTRRVSFENGDDLQQQESAHDTAIPILENSTSLNKEQKNMIKPSTPSSPKPSQEKKKSSKRKKKKSKKSNSKSTKDRPHEHSLDELPDEDTSHSSCLDFHSSHSSMSSLESGIIEQFEQREQESAKVVTDLWLLSTEDLEAELERRRRCEENSRVDASKEVDEIMDPFENPRWRHHGDEDKVRKQEKDCASVSSSSSRRSSSSKRSTSRNKTKATTDEEIVSSSSSKSPSSKSKHKKKKSSKTETEEKKRQVRGPKKEISSNQDHYVSPRSPPSLASDRGKIHPWDVSHQHEDADPNMRRIPQPSRSSWGTAKLSNRFYGNAPPLVESEIESVRTKMDRSQQSSQSLHEHSRKDVQESLGRENWNDMALSPPSAGKEVEPEAENNHDEKTSNSRSVSAPSSFFEWMSTSFTFDDKNYEASQSEYGSNEERPAYTSWMSGGSMKDVRSNAPLIQANEGILLKPPPSTSLAAPTSISESGNDASSVCSAPESRSSWMSLLTASQRYIGMLEEDGCQSANHNNNTKPKDPAKEQRGSEEAAKILAQHAPAASYSLADKQYMSRKQERLGAMRAERARRKAQQDAQRLERIQKWDQQIQKEQADEATTKGATKGLKMDRSGKTQAAKSKQ